MQEIPEINIRSLSIPEIPDYLTTPPQSIPTAVPVTVQLGFPVVDVPGCVEAHREGNSKNTTLTEDDPNGTLTFCDGHVPSFNPINYEPESDLGTPSSTLPPYKPPETDFKLPDTKKLIPEIPKVPVVKEPVEEVPVEEDFNIIEYLPPAQAVVSTTVIAAAAATSALLARPVADFLLKIIKPVVKKLIKKMHEKLGRVPQVYSVEERREMQRELTEAFRAARKLRGK